MDRYKAFIFDFDGVIKESVHVKSNAFVELYKNEGTEFQEKVKDYHLANGGVSRYVKFKVWNEWLGYDTQATTIEAQARKFAELVIDEVVRSPFVRGAELALASAKKSGLVFVATGTPDTEIEIILGRLKLEKFFNEVHGSSQLKTQITQSIIDRHHLKKSEVLFIGDAMTDYQAAKETEIDFYLRETDYNAQSFTNKSDIKFRYPDLMGLERLINN